MPAKRKLTVGQHDGDDEQRKVVKAEHDKTSPPPSTSTLDSTSMGISNSRSKSDPATTTTTTTTTTMPKLIAVTGATGNQGGSVAKLLLQYPNEYRVRALTRNPDAPAAQALAKLGAELFKADLTVPADIPAAIEGCWGVFGVTNFYDSKITNDPGSEEQQGKNLVRAAQAAGVACFVWSTLPSSDKLSGGKFVSRIYEGKHHVDDFIREVGQPAAFLYTGNFYENMVLRSHVSYDKEKDAIEFRQPVILPDTKLAMVYVEKDISGVTKAIFDQWETKKDFINHKYLYVANARVTPMEIVSTIKKLTNKKTTYTVLPTTGVPDRDIMFKLYNHAGMYPGKELPDENLLALDVKFNNVEDYVRERLLPHLGLEAVN